MKKRKKKTLELAEMEKVGKVVPRDNGECVVRDERRKSPAERVVEPLKQGQVVYSAECLIEFPKRFDPIYRTVYVVEI